MAYCAAWIQAQQPSDIVNPKQALTIGLLIGTLAAPLSITHAQPADESLWDDGTETAIPTATAPSEYLWDDGTASAAPSETAPEPASTDTTDESLWDDGTPSTASSAAATEDSAGEDLWDDGSAPLATDTTPDTSAEAPADNDLWDDGGSPPEPSPTPSDSTSDDLWSDSPSSAHPINDSPSMTADNNDTANPIEFELSGDLSAEIRYFWKSPLNNEQNRSDLSIAAKPRFRWQWDGGNQSFTLQPFARLDSVDSKRTHADLREALYQTSGGPLTVRIGVGQVFWGVTEARHVVDIINQTDLVENPEQEDKLGQPMVNATLYTDDWGNIDLFVLPWFRERTFPGRDGRLRTTQRVLNKDAQYSDDSKRRRIDFAARWSHNIDAWDIAVSQFHGTSREPLFIPAQDGNETVLLQSYDIIEQTGLELQYAAGSALLKFEGYSRWGQGEQFFALDTGIEYTFGDVAGSGADIGLLAEYLYEGRDLGRWNDAIVFNSFSNAVMAGMRFALNDTAGTDGLASIIFDRKSDAKLFKLEASRRINDNLRFNLQVFGFIDIPEDDPAYTLRRDSFAKLELSYYF